MQIQNMRKYATSISYVRTIRSFHSLLPFSPSPSCSPSPSPSPLLRPFSTKQKMPEHTLEHHSKVLSKLRHTGRMKAADRMDDAANRMQAALVYKTKLMEKEAEKAAKEAAEKKAAKKE